MQARCLQFEFCHVTFYYIHMPWWQCYVSTDHYCTDHIPTTYRPHTDHILTTYRPHTDHIPTTYRPPLPTTYRQFNLFHITDHYCGQHGIFNRVLCCHQHIIILPLSSLWSSWAQCSDYSLNYCTIWQEDTMIPISWSCCVIGKQWRRDCPTSYKWWGTPSILLFTSKCCMILSRIFSHAFMPSWVHCDPTVNMDSHEAFFKQPEVTWASSRISTHGWMSATTLSSDTQVARLSV